MCRRRYADVVADGETTRLSLERERGRTHAVWCRAWPIWPMIGMLFWLGPLAYRALDALLVALAPLGLAGALVLMVVGLGLILRRERE